MKTEIYFQYRKLLKILDKTKKTPIDKSKFFVQPDIYMRILPVFKKNIGLSEYHFLELFWKEVGMAFQHAKQGKFDKSARKFAIAKNQMSKFKGEAQQLAELFYYQQIAYLYYRRGNSNEANRFIESALRSSECLQVTYPIFHFHCIHLIQNKCRILIAEDKYDEAAATLVSILNYLINPNFEHRYGNNYGELALYKFGDWINRTSNVQGVPFIFENVVFRFCQDSTRFSEFELKVICQSRQFIKDLQLVVDRHPTYQMTFDWLAAKHLLYYDEDYISYIDKVCVFFDIYDEKYISFKFLLLIDIFRILDAIGLQSESQKISSFIKGYFKLNIEVV